MSFSRLFPSIPIILLIVCSLQGCAKVHPPAEDAFISAENVWFKFRQRLQDRKTTESFFIKSAIHYQTERKKNRLLLTLWGNSKYPIRAEIRAGIGTILSMWREDSEEWLAYYPSENTAYTHPDGRTGMTAFGHIIPFDLKDLSNIITGQWQTILPRFYTSSRSEAAREWTYFFPSNDTIESITLDYHGFVRSVRGKGRHSWHLLLENREENQAGVILPSKLTLTLASGESAVLWIKKFTLSDAPKSEDRLELKLPADARILRILDKPL